MGLEGGINNYVYAADNPGRLSDPTGEWSIGGGRYAGGGVEFSLTGDTCCEGGRPKKVIYLTACVGFAAGYSFKTRLQAPPVLPGIPTGGKVGICPQKLLPEGR